MDVENPAFNFSEAYTKYLAAPPHSCHMTLDEAADLCRDLAQAVAAKRFSPEVIVGLANGAIFPTQHISVEFGLPYHMVQVRRRGSRYKQRLLFIKQRLRVPSGLIMWGPIRRLWVLFQSHTNDLETALETFDFDVLGKRVLIVDDCVDTGASLRYVADRLRSAGAAAIFTAVFCWSRMPKVDEAQSRPNVFLHRQTQFYPWSSNSKYGKDFGNWLRANGLTLWN